MEFWITIVGLLRRKWVIIPAVLVALALSAGAYLQTPKTYVSSTTMVLTTTQYGGTQSQDPASPDSLTNPLLNFNESLRTTSAILIQAMSTRDVATQLGVHRPTKLVVDDGRSNPELLGLNGPFLFIRVDSTSRDEAARIVVEAQQLMRQKLKEWQDSLGAPEQTFVSLVDVVSPSAPQADHARATKLGLMAAVFGFVLSMGIAYFAHQRRARRRARATAPAAVKTAPPPGVGPRPDPDPRPSPSPVLVPPTAVRTVSADSTEPTDVPTVSAKDTEPTDVPTVSAKNTEPTEVPTVSAKNTEPTDVPTVSAKNSEPTDVPTVSAKNTEPPAVPAVAAGDRAPAEDPTPTRDETEPTVVAAVPVKQVRPRPATATKRGRPGPAITPKKKRGRATPAKQVTPVPAAQRQKAASVPAASSRKVTSVQAVPKNARSGRP